MKLKFNPNTEDNDDVDDDDDDDDEEGDNEDDDKEDEDGNTGDEEDEDDNEDKEHIGVFISMAETNSLPTNWEVNAVVTIFLYNHISDNYLCFRGNN